jgi:FixJ family two-component response regulator
VLDVNMPGLNGIELQKQLAEQDGDLPIVFMTGHGDIPMSVQAMKAGAADFLPKPVDDERLLATVRQAIDSHAQTRQQLAEMAEFRGRRKSLTTREREVMELVVTGMLNKQIAGKLEIKEATVKVHRGRMMEKIGVVSVAELVRLSERADRR